MQDRIQGFSSREAGRLLGYISVEYQTGMDIALQWNMHFQEKYIIIIAFIKYVH